VIHRHFIRAYLFFSQFSPSKTLKLSAFDEVFLSKNNQRCLKIMLPVGFISNFLLPKKPWGLNSNITSWLSFLKTEPKIAWNMVKLCRNSDHNDIDHVWSLRISWYRTPWLLSTNVATIYPESLFGLHLNAKDMLRARDIHYNKWWWSQGWNWRIRILTIHSFQIMGQWILCVFFWKP